MNPADFASYSTGDLCNANPRVAALPSAIVPLIRGRRVAGRALTARIVPGHNAAVHRAVRRAQPGDLLVVDGAGSDRFGPFGDLLAEACQRQGIVGAVFDCTIRDSADIASLGFPVFSRGFHPEATAKSDPGEVDVALSVGRATVRPGDIVVGDDDGVVVVPAEVAERVLDQAAQVTAREVEIRARVAAGETTFDIFNLGSVPSADLAGDVTP